MASVNKKQPRRPNDPASGSAPPGGGASVPLRRGSWRGAGGSSSGVPSPSSSPAPPSPAGPRPSDGPAGTTAGGVPPMQPKPSAAGLDGGGGPSSPLASPARGESPPADPLLAKIASFAGSKVDLILRSNARFQGTLAPAETSPQGSTTITLRMARDVSSPHQALTREMRWPASVVADVVKTTEAAAGKHGLNSDGFRTDRDISRNVPLGHERELTPWQALPVSSSSPSNTAGNGHSDFDTFGPSAGAGPSGSGRSSMGGWDQFAENERRFGTKTDFHEEMYTTKLDRSGKDFRERERRAEILASQIMGTASSNSHIQEERGQKLEDSSLGEEDKYSGVIRSNNAYVPPGARRTSGAAAGALKGAAAAVPSDVAKTALTEPAAAAPAPAPAPAAPKVEAAPAVAPTAPAAAPAASPATADKLALPATKATSFGAGESPAGSSSGEKTALSAFHEFVKSDRQRLELKKKQLEGKAKTEKDKRLKELMRFGQDFKLKTAIPEDLVPILAKDAEKQKAIVEKAAADARLAAARAAEKQAAAAAATAAAAAEAAAASPSPTPSAAKSVSSVASFANRRNLPPVVPGTSPQLPSTQAAAAAVKASPPTGRLSSMAIQDIPPFSRKPKSPAVTPAQPAPPPAPASALAPVPPSAAAAAVPRLNANAPTFVFKPTAPAFKPAGAAASSSSPASSSKSPSSILPEIPPHRSTLIQNQAGPSSHHGTPPPHHQQPQAQQASALPPNPFFGTKPFKKASSQVVNVRDDFNPHKHQKLAEASVQPPTWGTTGRPYRHLFPPAFSALGGGVGVGVMGGLTVGGGGGPQGHEGMPSPGMAHMALHPPLPPSGLVDFSNPYGPGVGVVDGVGVVHPGALTLGAAMAPGGQPPTMVSPSMLHAQLGGGVGGQPVPHQAGGGYPYGAGAGAYGQHGGGGYPYRGYPPPHHANGATGFQQPPGPPGGGGPTPPGGGGGGGGYMSHQQMYAAAAAAAAAGGGGGPPPNVYGGGGAGGPPHMQRNTSMGGAPPGGGNYYGGMQQSPQIGHSHIFPQQQQQQQQQQQPPPPPPFSPGPPPPPPGLPTTTTTTTTTAPSNSHGPPPPPPAAAPPVGGGH